MKPFDQLRALKSQLESFTDAHSDITNAAIEGNRDLSADEISQLADLELRASSHRAKINAIDAPNRQAAADKAEQIFAAREGGLTVSAKNRVPAKAVTHPTLFASHQTAFDCGQWLRAQFCGHEGARQHCIDRGLIKATMTTGSNPAGGFLVPEPLTDKIIELRQQYGVFRRNAQQISMGDAVQIIPKMASEVTPYFVGEGSPSDSANAITASDMSLAQVRLEAKKLATLTVMSSELNEDSIISVADMLSRSIAYGFANQEDLCGFLGDGTSTYGSIVGLASALAAGSKATATGHTTVATLTMGDFEACIGKAKLWSLSPKWYISRSAYTASMLRLMDAYSGNTVMTIANGAPQFQFLGYPVEFSQVLPDSTAASGTTVAYFGDLSTGAYMGTRRDITIALDTSLYFNYDAIALRATERFDINVFDRGTASDSGGIVALVLG